MRSAATSWTAALALTLIGLAGPAFAVEPASAVGPDAPATNGEAERLIRTGHPAEAHRLLEALLKGQPDNSQTLFLLGVLATGRKDYAEAIADFRKILIREPNVGRVRLELARAFFLKGDYENAERQFRLAEAGGLPAAVEANVRTYMAAIRQARSWTASLSVSAAPDTNLNRGTTAQDVQIFGLPFQLSQDARRKSGVGVDVDLAGEWSPRLTASTRLRLGGQLHSADYSGSEFDDVTLAAYGGPRLSLGRWDVTPMATGFGRWYGNQPYARGEGGRLEAEISPSPLLRVVGAVSSQDIRYDVAPDQNGWVSTAELYVLRALTPSSLVRGSVSVSRQDAHARPLANTAADLRVGYYRDLPLGFSAYLEPTIGSSKYDAVYPAFGVTRSDRRVGGRIDLLSRKISYRGFAPRGSYVFTRQTSNIDLYTYTRNEFELGLTRVF